MNHLFDILRVSCRASLSSKKKCLQSLAELIENSLDENELDDSVDMDVMDALAARERLGCTGIGHGVAIPHGRVDFISEPVGAAITLAEPVDFDAADGQPVDNIIGLLIPEHEVDGHLKTLASLAKFFNEAQNRDSIRDTRSSAQMLAILKSLDQPDESDEKS